MTIGVLHGPNLNLLGQREPEVYGYHTLEQINDSLTALARELGISLRISQSNSEGGCVGAVQQMAPDVAGVLVNAAGFTHTSVALRDALIAIARPYVEVHLSNVWAREAFRHHSLLADRALGVVAGFGPASYLLGLRALAAHLGDAAGESRAG